IRNSKETIVFDKDIARNWNLPGGWPTRKKPGMRELIDLLTHLDSRFLPYSLRGDVTAQTYGIDDSAVAVTLKLQNGMEYRLRFAQPSAADDANRGNRPTYLQLATKDGSDFKDMDEVIRLAPDALPILQRPLATYQQRRLFPGERV